jgi:hypothetical protein
MLRIQLIYLYALESALKLKPVKQPAIRKFTIEVVNCIGACSIAPVITVNDEYHGRIAVKDIPNILKKYTSVKKGSSCPGGECCMKNFLDHCCEECWHSSEKPCDLFVRCCTEGPLCHHNECEEKFRKLNNQLKYIDA